MTTQTISPTRHLEGMDLFDAVLPKIGQKRVNTPVWDPERSFFICDESESQAGNRRYKGVRVTENLVIVEQIGDYHTCHYLNCVMLYAFDGYDLKLISQHDFDKEFYSDAKARAMTEKMIRGYFQTQFKLLHKSVPDEMLSTRVKQLVDNSRLNLLDDDSTRILLLADKVLKQQPSLT